MKTILTVASVLAAFVGGYVVRQKYGEQIDAKLAEAKEKLKKMREAESEEAPADDFEEVAD